MKEKILLSVLSLLLLTSLIGLIFQKPKVSKSFWQSYFVLAVDKDFSSNLIVSFLEDSQINNFIYSDSPSYAFDKNKLPFGIAYRNTNLFFMDEDQNYQLFYIPNQYKNIFTNKHFVEKIPFSYILDISVKKNYILFVFLAIIFLLLFIHTKQKIFFVISSFPLLVFSLIFTEFLFAPFYISLFYLIFFISLLYKRKAFMLFCKKNIFFKLFFAFCFFSLFLGDYRFFFISLFIILFTFSFSKIFLTIETHIEKKRRFAPIFILNSFQKKELAFSKAYLFFPFLFSLIFLAIFSFFNISLQSQNKLLYIPYPLESSTAENFSLEGFEKSIANFIAKNEYQNNNFLPQLSFLISDSWNFKRYPYVSVYDEEFYDKNFISFPKANDSISFSYFPSEEKGLEKSEKIIDTFDNSFIASILESIHNELSVETLLKSQNCFTEIVYEALSKIIGEENLQIKLLFSCVFPLFLISLIFIQNKRKVLI